MGTKPNWGRGIGAGMSALGRMMFMDQQARNRREWTEQERIARDESRMQMFKDQLDYSDPMWEGVDAGTLGSFAPGMEAPEPNRYLGMRTSDALDAQRFDRTHEFRVGQAEKDDAHRAAQLKIMQQNANTSSQNANRLANPPTTYVPPPIPGDTEFDRVSRLAFGQVSGDGWAPQGLFDTDLYELYGEQLAQSAQAHLAELARTHDVRDPLVQQHALDLAMQGMVPSFGNEIYDAKGGRFYDPTQFRDDESSWWNPIKMIGSRDEHAQLGPKGMEYDYQPTPQEDYFSKVVQPVIDRDDASGEQVLKWAKKMKIPEDVLMEYLTMPPMERPRLPGTAAGVNTADYLGLDY